METLMKTSIKYGWLERISTPQPCTHRRWPIFLTSWGILLLACAPVQAASNFQFWSTRWGVYRAAEDQGGAEITIHREQDIGTDASVEFATVEYTNPPAYYAKPGEDYIPVSTRVFFQAGETNKIVSVPIVNDNWLEDREYIDIVLRNPSPGAVLGDPSSETILLDDNDLVVPASWIVWVREDEGVARIALTREGDLGRAVTVTYKIYDGGSAIAGLDFIAPPGALEFAADETVKYVEIPILNDTTIETNEIIGGEICMHGFSIIILDNDANPGVQFELGSYSAFENRGPLILRVVRNNDLDLSPFTVDVATGNGSATAGKDYEALHETLHFAQGELIKTLVVPIYDDGVPELDEDFTMTLGNPSGSAFLGSNSTVKVTIIEPVNPLLLRVMESVQGPDLLDMLKQVTGEEPVLVGGTVQVLTNRDTLSGSPIRTATQYAAERLQALGLQVRYQDWKGADSETTISNRNVIVIQPGRGHPDEVVVLAAHYDDVGGPGADDNATGSSAVLIAAGLLTPYQFDRTIHYVLFTGEENGLLGSGQFAMEAQAGGTNIVAALVLDMLGCPVSDPGASTLMVPGRSWTDPLSVEMRIASVFTNVVENYSPACHMALSTKISSPYMGVSDEEQFWARNIPAVWVYDGGGTPIHSPQDIIDRVNLDYFTATVRAIVGTTAQLARPVGSEPLAILEVSNSDWTPGSGIGGSLFLAKFEEGASEGESDPHDVTWSLTPSESTAKWLRVQSEPYGLGLQTDARPSSSETTFRLKLLAGDTTGTGLSCSNGLRFRFLTAPDPDLIYVVRVHVEGRYAQDSGDFDCITNLAKLATVGGFLRLPSIADVPAGAVYGTCDLSVRSLDREPRHCALRTASMSERSISIVAPAQLGARTIDTLEISTNLAVGTAWTPVMSYTNDVRLDAAHFDSGWTEVVHEFERSMLPPSGSHFFRIRRTWTQP
jgi:hypothetical protein